MSFQESALNRIKELLQVNAQQARAADIGETLAATINFCVNLYGKDSPQLHSIETTRKELWSSKYPEDTKQHQLCMYLQGLLRNIASDLLAGRVQDLQLQARGEVFADFVNAARSALSEGFKDIAAVLACGALEDALKRFAITNGLEVYDKDMSEVVNALKGASLIKGPQGALLQGFIKIRNKVFHAQWSDVDAADVQGVIGFTQEFLLARFPSEVS